MNRSSWLRGNKRKEQEWERCCKCGESFPHGTLTGTLKSGQKKRGWWCEKCFMSRREPYEIQEENNYRQTFRRQHRFF